MYRIFDEDFQVNSNHFRYNITLKWFVSVWVNCLPFRITSCRMRLIVVSSFFFSVFSFVTFFFSRFRPFVFRFCIYLFCVVYFDSFHYFLFSHNILALLFDANLFLGTLRYTIERTLTLTLDCQFSLAVGLCKLFGHIDEIQRTSENNSNNNENSIRSQ